MEMGKTLLALGVASVLLVGCKQQEEAAAEPVAEAPAESAPAPAPAEQATLPPPGVPAEAKPFDIASLPVTDKPLGDWPYLVAPQGYEWNGEKTLDLSRVPFWTGQALEFVEGKVFLGGLQPIGDKSFSRFEVLKRADQALTGLGATKVTTSGISDAIHEKDMPENFGSEFYAGAGGYRSSGKELSTYVIRHADRTVWFKVFADTNSGSILIAETEPVAAAAP